MGNSLTERRDYRGLNESIRQESREVVNRSQVFFGEDQSEMILRGLPRDPYKRQRYRSIYFFDTYNTLISTKKL